MKQMTNGQPETKKWKQKNTNGNRKRNTDRKRNEIRKIRKKKDKKMEIEKYKRI